jgi:FkbM family methyltransferase
LGNLRRSAFEMAGNDRYSRPALNNLDAKLSRYLTKNNGIFIEAGANDGFTQSNTYYLEKFRNWNGLLVEAIPSLYEKARRRRSNCRVFNCALVPFGQEGEDVELTYGNLMSVVKGAMGNSDAEAEHFQRAKQHDPKAGTFSVKVPGRCLSSLVEECGFQQIDFLSLDVEGFEEQVLRGIDFSRHRPAYICVEARYRRAVEGVLLPYYELVEQLTDMDLLFHTIG